MTRRPRVLVSIAMSLDGYIDDAASAKLPLSNASDFSVVDQLRAEADAILVGARTVRADNASLLIKDPALRAQRVAEGRPENPKKVTLTARGDLPVDLNFWMGDAEKIVYATNSAAARLGAPSVPTAEVVAMGSIVDIGEVLDDLGARGVRVVVVEGGSFLLSGLLASDLVDEIRLAVAPVVIGQEDAPRLLRPGAYPGGPTSRMHLAGVHAVGDMAILTYVPASRAPLTRTSSLES